MSSQIINFVRVFTAAPGARFRTQGKFSGEAFREDFLKPAIQRGDVIVDLNGALGLPPSFLDEVFGVLLNSDPSLASHIKVRLTDDDMSVAVLKESLTRRLNKEIAEQVFE